MSIDSFIRDLAWYDLPGAGWQLIHISSRQGDRLRATGLGRDITFELDPKLTRQLEPRNVVQLFTAKSGERNYEAYFITPGRGIEAPHYWLVLQDGHSAGGEASGREEAEEKARSFVESDQVPRASA